ncbi:MAG TPA: CYTH domain-containing protein [Candidatus Pacearchaeota archaeon]|nr:CYTH domain-containing protein [Candidatus Parcubacteria bacterium]HOU45798.1 CYTH domain-containing protein [Candidatus Pacearchaeota archaeon]HQI74527.1 CYTH domain-containing protein [Candidatus Pacearchaeota archaeon]
MIEVEKKIRLDQENKELLLAGAQFIGRKELNDIYYDKNDYELTCNDIWIRSRNGNFQIKIGIKGAKGDQYKEIEDDEEIKKFLNIPEGKSIDDFLDENDFKKFCIFHTIREKYSNNGFSIEIDESKTDDGFLYNLAEIEVMVKDEEEINQAREKIMNFLKEKGISSKNLFLGKVLEYLKEIKKEHFIALVKRGIV